MCDALLSSCSDSSPAKALYARGINFRIAEELLAANCDASVKPERAMLVACYVLKFDVERPATAEATVGIAKYAAPDTPKAMAEYLAALYA